MNPRTIPKVGKGDPITATGWNRIGDSIRELSPQPSNSSVAVMRAAQRTIPVEIVSLATTAPWVLTCVPWTERTTAGGTSNRSITVRPPFLMYVATRGAVTYTYTDMNNRVADGTENQQITPVQWVVGDILLVAIVGGEAYDLNLDSRAWAKVP